MNDSVWEHFSVLQSEKATGWLLLVSIQIALVCSKYFACNLWFEGETLHPFPLSCVHNTPQALYPSVSTTSVFLRDQETDRLLHSFFFFNCVCLLPTALVYCIWVIGHGAGWCAFPRKGGWMCSFACIAAQNYSKILSKVELLTLKAYCHTLSGQSTNLLGSWTAKWTLWPPGRINFLLPAWASWQNSNSWCKYVVSLQG